MVEEIIKEECINPYQKITLNAGQYDEKHPPPRFELRITPKHKANLVEWKEENLGTPERYTLVYRIRNQSDSLVFVELVKII